MNEAESREDSFQEEFILKDHINNIIESNNAIENSENNFGRSLDVSSLLPSHTLHNKNVDRIANLENESELNNSYQFEKFIDKNIARNNIFSQNNDSIVLGEPPKDSMDDSFNTPIKSSEEYKMSLPSLISPIRIDLSEESFSTVNEIKTEFGLAEIEKNEFLCEAHNNICISQYCHFNIQPPLELSESTVNLNDTSITSSISPQKPQKMHCKYVITDYPLKVLTVEIFPFTLVNKTPIPSLNPLKMITYSIISQSDFIHGIIHAKEVEVKALPNPDYSFNHHFNPLPDEYIELIDNLENPFNEYKYMSKAFPKVVVKEVENEIDLFKHLLKIIRYLNPDLFVSFEIEQFGWKYIIERSHYLEIPFLQLASRCPYLPPDFRNGEGDSVNEIWGRILYDIRRSIRHDIKIKSYTFESLVKHLLQKTIPVFSFHVLSQWNANDCFKDIYLYFLDRISCVHGILDSLNFPDNIIQLCSLVGTSFESISSRGSQFFIEAILFRITRLYNYILISPSYEQVHNMPPLECLPMVLEPKSNYYTDPVAVFDFQSMYPSIMVAYNYCFSTCFGQLNIFNNASFKNVLGIRSYTPFESLISEYNEDITCSPNYVLFSNRIVRTGIIPLMIQSLLESRFLLKDTLKYASHVESVKRLYTVRQNVIKGLVNTCYGYVGASFSGRMPCSAIADSIVETARLLLKHTMDLIHSKYKYDVVYGDTDSIFLHLKNCTLEEAFKISNEIASKKQLFS